jgi:hypothetical protein
MKSVKAIFRRPDQKHGLKDPDGQAGDADGHHFKYPPGSRQKKDRQGPFCLFAEGKMFSHGVNGIGPGWGHIDNNKEKNPYEKKYDFGPVDF